VYILAIKEKLDKKFKKLQKKDKEMLRLIERKVPEWMETARSLGKEIPQLKGKLAYA
jgi:hypothetical protein